MANLNSAVFCQMDARGRITKMAGFEGPGFEEETKERICNFDGDVGLNKKQNVACSTTPHVC